jgi:hypothetical protein
LPLGSKANSRIQAVPVFCHPTLEGLPLASTEKMAMLPSVRFAGIEEAAVPGQVAAAPWLGPGSSAVTICGFETLPVAES